MNLEHLRQVVDKLNAEIIELFSERLKVTREIARLKKQHHLPVCDPAREEEQRKLLRELARHHDLNPLIIEEIFTLFVDYSKFNMKMEMGER
jgi:chorismate mutase